MHFVWQTIIERFGETAEPEFPGHVVLEQYQAQVGAALRPAFAADEAPSHVTAAACDVCSAWLGSGVARDPGDLRRVYQLLVSSLGKLRPKSSPLYNESALTLEKLSILKAWAEVYLVCIKSEAEAASAARNNDAAVTVAPTPPPTADDFGDFESASSMAAAESTKSDEEEGLAALVQNELPSLSRHWLAALKDHALLSLPPVFKAQLPREGGAFYSSDTLENARTHYRATWPAILSASSAWLSYGGGFDDVSAAAVADCVDDDSGANLGLGAANAAAGRSPEEVNTDRFFLLFGIAMEALSHARSADMTKEETAACLSSLKALLDHAWARRGPLAASSTILVELCNVLHRTVLTRDSPKTHVAAMEVLDLVLTTARERAEQERKKRQKELELPANADGGQRLPELDELGEGGETGDLPATESVVYATLEVCLCVLVRHYPSLSKRAASLHSAAAVQARSRRRAAAGGALADGDRRKLIATAIRAVASLPSLCSPVGAAAILPSSMWLITGVLREETSSRDSLDVDASADEVSMAALSAIRGLATSKYAKNPKSSSKWEEVMRNSLLRLLGVLKTSSPSAAQETTTWPGETTTAAPAGPDEGTLLQAIAIFVLRCPPAVFLSGGVLYPAINAVSRGLTAGDARARQAAASAAHQIFAMPERQAAMPFIRGVAPTVFYHVAHPTSHLPKSEDELQLTLECSRAVDVLLARLRREEEADSAENKVQQLLSFYVPALVDKLLSAEEAKEACSFRRRLHDWALERLTSLGREQATAFRATLAASPDLKARLEKALLADQARRRAAAAEGEAAATAAAERQRKQRDHQPTIKLSMDFSQFASAAGQK